MPKRMPAVKDTAVQALIMLVDLLPRGARPAKQKDGTPHPMAGVPYTGVLANIVATNFYNWLSDPDNAGVYSTAESSENKDCDFYAPCGHCHRCVLEVVSDAAQATGKVIKIPRTVKKTVDGRIKEIPMVTYYREGEVAKTGANLDVLAQVKARLR
jgi:hypothetical protein